jgi:probable HAF family extracellular repeat protein
MTRSLLIVSSISLLALVANAQVSFTPLGLFDATGVSGDGSVVVGNWRGQLNFEPYRWTRSEGAVPLLPPGYSHGLPWEDQSRANAISVDGSTVVGTQNFPGPYYYGWRWRADTGMTPITPYASSYFAEAVSGDGTVIVGPKRDSNFPGWRWSADEGLTNLADQQFNAVSGDGSVFAGGRVLWSEQAGTVDLGDLPGGRDYTLTRAISADGTTVVGTSSSSDGILEGEAFRWTAASGMVGLGDLPGSLSYSVASGVSGDGSIVVGSGYAENYVQAAFLWTNDLGMVDFRDYLVSQGVDHLGGWTLGGATAISADGSTIVGWGTNPQGVTEGWVATIPEPSSLLLIGVAGLGLLTAVIRHRGRTARHRQTASGQ